MPSPLRFKFMLADLLPVLSSRTLNADEIRGVAADLLKTEAPDDLKADFLRAWALRGETAAELAACAEAFLPVARKPGVQGSWQNQPLLDCCGTGGGGLNLINISTGLMFVLAALGIPVVKHGNRGLTKKSGSADVLEALGLRIDLPPEKVERCLEEVGCAFLFAPAYHLSFAAVSAARRQLGAEGQRTIFNLLGPLLNPARPDARLVGVFKFEHVALYREALEKMGCPRFSVVCGQDAASSRMLGEVSAHGPTAIMSTISPQDGAPLDYLEWLFADEPTPRLESLLVADVAESARRLIALLRGEERGLGREMLVLNAAVASWTQGSAASLEEGLAQAAEALDSGSAYERLTRWQKFSEAAQ
jgi:anthranilate phosphoribosyltransferase